MLDPDYISQHDNKRLAVNLWLQDIPSPYHSIVHPANYVFPRPVIPSYTHGPCTMIRASEKSLANLAASGTVLLFTPVVLPAGTARATSKTSGQIHNIDPFESLGRALSRYHKRVRHVPYVPGIGFTETHDAFLSQADVVIVVMCEPETEKHEGLGYQSDFAENANEALKESLAGRTMKYPLIVIQCGNQEASRWPDASSFETLIKCRSYDQEIAQMIAKRLFS